LNLADFATFPLLAIHFLFDVLLEHLLFFSPSLYVLDNDFVETYQLECDLIIEFMTVAVISYYTSYLHFGLSLEYISRSMVPSIQIEQVSTHIITFTPFHPLPCTKGQCRYF